MPQAPGQVAAGDAAAELAMRVPELEAEVAELKDRLLRAMAETENVRRRAARDREDASKYAIANFAREVLGVADNLRRALDSVDADTRAGNEALETLAVGVEMTERELLASMERVGIRPIEAMGKRFDHNFHEAMFEIEDPSQPAGTVLQELQAGYMLGERLLRPSRVGVSKGGPKEPPAAAPAEGETDPAGTGAKDPYDKKPGAAGGTLDEEL
ncbi:MAG: nucleotide exchange factor GrpE [Hyphomicrobiales bacterium]|nr:nucleotide exchange factor GrpE [Hyphomicrobiales bacterium]